LVKRFKCACPLWRPLLEVPQEDLRGNHPEIGALGKQQARDAGEVLGRDSTDSEGRAVDLPVLRLVELLEPEWKADRIRSAGRPGRRYAVD
jgi:hypothetical protein